jgi:hypothetical protein
MHTPLKHVTVYLPLSTTVSPFDLACLSSRSRILIWKADTRVFAPAHSPIFGKNNAYLTKLVPLAMQHPVLFEGLIALSQCHLTARSDLTRPNQESLYHRGQALLLLRRKVTSSSTPPDDAAIWTSILLLGMDVSRCALEITLGLFLTMLSPFTEIVSRGRRI